MNKQQQSGYWGIGIYHVKYDTNIGTLWRTAHILGASFIFTIYKRYKKQASDTLKTTNHIPLYHYSNIQDLIVHLPIGCQLIGIESSEQAISLSTFTHPKQCCYLLGAEDHGLPDHIIYYCHQTVKLGGKYCFNVAVAGSIVAYHRFSSS